MVPKNDEGVTCLRTLSTLGLLGKALEAKPSKYTSLDKLMVIQCPILTPRLFIQYSI